MDRIIVRHGRYHHTGVDAIVNAANETLLGGGGVDGAIHRAAGPRLLAECRALGGCPTGQAKITSGLSSEGPLRYPHGRAGLARRRARRGGAARQLPSGKSDLAVTHGIRTIAFPAISCGVYGYPVPEAARIAIDTTAAFLDEDRTLTQVIFACFGEAVFSRFRRRPRVAGQPETEDAQRSRSAQIAAGDIDVIGPWAIAARLADRPHRGTEQCTGRARTDQARRRAQDLVTSPWASLRRELLRFRRAASTRPPLLPPVRRCDPPSSRPRSCGRSCRRCRSCAVRCRRR